MPKKFTVDTSLNEMERQSLFTRAALKADPDAEEFVPETDNWLPAIDEVRRTERERREVVADTDARRTVANARLDIATTAFGRDLLHDLRHDRQSPRWKQYFSQKPSKVVRQPLRNQVTMVRAWLSSGMDPTLDMHRGDLARWADQADQALVATDGTALVRGQAQIARTELAEYLTAERDRLHRRLGELAAARGLPRDWPESFFYVAPRRKKAADDDEELEETDSAE